MINVGLAKSRGIDRRTAERIQQAQNSIDILLIYWEYGHYRGSRKWLKETVQEHEYELQYLWGFTIDRDRHTHWKRFEGLYRKRGKKQLAVSKSV